MSASLDTLPDPIVSIRDEHERQREVCHLLEELVSASDNEPLAARAASLLKFVTEDLQLHVEDEEQDLFPLLLKSKRGVGNLEQIVDQLLIEHESDKELAEVLAGDLRELAEGAPLRTAGRLPTRVRAFCELQRRHLNWEDRVVLPLADRLLGEADRQCLAGRMLARRRKAKRAAAD